MNIAPAYKEGETLSFKAENYSSSFLHKVWRLYQDKEQCDVQLSISGRIFDVHKIVLVLSSDYFKELFAQGYELPLSLDGIKADVMEKILEFLYTGTIDIESSMMCEVYDGAKRFLIHPLAQWCEDTFPSSACINTCLRHLITAEKHSLTQLYESSLHLARQNFNDICRQEDFLSISPDVLKDILISDQLNCESEREVYKAFRRWLDFNDQFRCKASLILEHVRFGLISTKENNDLLKEDDLFAIDEDKANFIHRATEFHGNNQEKPLFAGPFCRPRTPPCLLILGGVPRVWTKGVNVPKFVHDSMVILNPRSESFNHPRRKQINLPSKRFMATALNFNNFLFLIGGCGSVHGKDSPEVEDTVFRYNPLDNKWTVQAHLLEGRCLASGFILGPFIYMAGGVGSTSYLETVECYNIKKNIWEYTTKLPECIYEAACCSLSGKGYISGGWRVNKDKSSAIIAFNKFEWKYVADMLESRIGHSMCSDDTNVYIFGGITEIVPLKSAEMYNPITNQVCRLSCIPGGRSSACSLHFNGRIFICGGVGAKDEDHFGVTDTILLYDIAENTWLKMKNKLPHPLSQACCSLVIFPHTWFT